MPVEEFKCDPSVDVSVTMTLVGAATAHAALSKEQTAPEGKPATEPRVTTVTASQVCNLRYKVPEALKKRIEEGWKVVEIRLMTNAELRTVAGKPVKITFGGKTEEPELAKLVQAWVFVGIPATEAEVLAHQTVAKLEEMVGEYEHRTTKELWLFESYLKVGVESPPAEEPEETMLV